jgi:hypothetical protein
VVLGGRVRIAEECANADSFLSSISSSTSVSSSSYLIYPIRGGAIIGVFMIQALKGALWGI